MEAGEDSEAVEAGWGWVGEGLGSAEGAMGLGWEAAADWGSEAAVAGWGLVEVGSG